MLSTFSVPSSLGISMAISLLPILYSLIISEIFFCVVYNKFSDGTYPQTTSPPWINLFLPIIITFALLITFLLMLLAFTEMGVAMFEQSSQQKTSSIIDEPSQIQDVNALIKNYNTQLEWNQKLVAGYGAGIWYAKTNEKPQFVKKIFPATVGSIIRELNELYTQDGIPTVSFTKLEQKTAYIKASKKELFEPKKGSKAFQKFINSALYSIASIDDIHCIYLETEEKNHPLAGVYCK
jgi:hypothetical protein